MKRRIFFSLAFVLALSASSSMAQSGDSVPTAVTPGNKTGDLPYSTQIGTDVEHIELSMGRPVISIPIVSLPGRKVPFDFKLLYNSSFWTQTPYGTGIQIWNLEQRNWLVPGAVGWTTNMPYESYTSGQLSCISYPSSGGPGNGGDCGAGGSGGPGEGDCYPTDAGWQCFGDGDGPVTGSPDPFQPIDPGGGSSCGIGTGGTPSGTPVTNVNSAWQDGFIFTDEAGVKHGLHINTQQNSCQGGAIAYSINNSEGPSNDLNGIWSSGGNIFYPDGTSVSQTAGGSTQQYQGFVASLALMGRDEDVRQNTVMWGQTDSIGRTPLTTSVSGNIVTYGIKASDGSPANVVVTLESKQIATSFNQANVQEYQGTRQVVSSIALPNGQAYSFSHDSYGEVTHLTLPLGAAVDYTWSNGLSFCYSGGANNGRAITKRTVTNNGVISVWDFAYACSPQANDINFTTVSVTFPQVSSLNPTGPPVRAQSLYTYDSNQHLVKVEEFDAPGGNRLRSFLMKYGGATLDIGNVGDQLLSVTSVLDDGSTSRKEFDYDTYAFLYNPTDCRSDEASCEQIVESGNTPQSGYVPASHGNVTAVREYAWAPCNASAGVANCAPGPLLRQTLRQYLQDITPNYFREYLGTSQVGGPRYSDHNIVNHVVDETIYDGTVACSGVETVDLNTGALSPAPACLANKLSEVRVSYDQTTPATYGYFGEPTSTSKWLTGSGSGSYVTTKYSYDSHGNLISVTDPNGNPPTMIGYNDSWSGSTIAGCTPSQQSSVYPTSITNSLGHQTLLTYYPCTGMKASVRSPNDIANGNNGTTYSYDFIGRPIDTTLPDGGHTHNAYDDVNLTVTTSAFLDSTRAIVKKTLVDSLGNPIQTQLLSDPQGTVYADTTYDALGRTLTVSNPYRSTNEPTYGLTTLTYDALGRSTAKINPDGTTSSSTYTGPTVDSWDENGTHMRHTSDALGRLTKVMELGTATQPQNLETDYTYDALNNLKSVNQVGMPGTTPNGFPSSYTESSKNRSFTYDSLSRLITSTNPETGTICYGQWSGSTCAGGYDPNGNLLYKTDANNLTTSYTYDALNRLLTKSAPDSSTNFNYTYDTCIPNIPCGNPVGRLVQESNPNGHAGTAFAYDPMGRITNTTWLLYPYSIWFPGMGVNYDLAGNPIWIGYPDGLALTQTYDAAGRLSSITNVTQTPAQTGVGTVYFSNAQYTPAGALQSATYGNGVSESITYNNRLQPCHTSANSPAVAPRSGYGNVYDRLSSYANSPTSPLASPCNPEPGNNGNVAYIADNVHALWTQSFLYDGLNRLTTASRQDGVYNHTYNYDSFGNLIVQDNVNTPQSFSIDPARNQLLQNPIAGGSVLDSYGHPANSNEYDYAGNMVVSAATPFMASHAYTYNAQSQITSVDAGNTASYFYNGMDERSYKSTSGLQTTYMYLNGQPMSENATSGAGASLTGTWTDYVYANGQKIAKLTTSIYGGITTPNYYLNDHLGTTQVELDASGNVTWYGQFTPFGSELPDGSTSMHYKFTGKERDPESGLDYFGARYYGSSMGRFTSPDPKQASAHPNDPQTWSRYAYAGNNPLKFIDPNGMEKFLTIYVQQPIPNTREVEEGKGNFGHAFIGYRDTDVSREDTKVGFYPKNKFDLLSNSTVKGILKDDAASEWNIKYTYKLSDEGYSKLLADIDYQKSHPEMYNMEDNNCATWVIDEAAKVGMYLPRTEGNFAGASSVNPGDLGQDMMGKGGEPAPGQNTDGKSRKSSGFDFRKDYYILFNSTTQKGTYVYK